MAQESTYKMMRRLQKHEENVAGHIGNLDITQGSIRLARSVYCLAEDGSQDKSIQSWGTWAQPLKIPQMLLLQRMVSADVYPVDRGTFNQIYGVTPEQFADLAEYGFVIPNLIADSDLKNGEDKSQYARHPHLAQILDFSRTKCRINGVRREKLFELLNYGREKQKHTSLQFRLLLTPLLATLDLYELKKHIIGTFTNHTDVPIMLGNNMMYIDMLGTDSDRYILHGFLQKTLDWPLTTLINWIQGKSIYLAGPITSAYGGVHNLPQKHCEAIIRAGILRKHNESERTTDETTSAFAEFLQAASEVRSRGISLSELDLRNFQWMNSHSEILSHF